MAECTIYDKLRYIAETKELIKNAIESQDVEVLESATFRQYAEYITEIRKVSSVNGMQGDVVLTLEDLGGVELDTLKDYATKDELDGLILSLPTKVSELENDKGYITIEEIPSQDLSNYVTSTQLASALNTKQNVLTAGNGISITNNTISLDYTFDLFDIVQTLPTENIDSNKIYLVYDDSNEANSYIEYLYVNDKWEEIGKYKVNVDLTDYVKQTDLKTINGQSIIGEGDITIEVGTTDLSDYYTKGETDTLLSEKAEVIELTQEEYDALETKESDVIYIITNGEEIDLNSFATKNELNSKQDTLVSGQNIKTINGESIIGEGDITIEGGTADLSDYYTKGETNTLLNDKLEQVTLTQAEYDALETKENNILYVISDAEDIKFKTINGESIVGEGDITVTGSGTIDLSDYYTKSEIDELIGFASATINDINDLVG